MASLMFATAETFGWMNSMPKWEREGRPNTSKILLGVHYDFVNLAKYIPEDKALFAQKQIWGFLRLGVVQVDSLLSCMNPLPSKLSFARANTRQPALAYHSTQAPPLPWQM